MADAAALKGVSYHTVSRAVRRGRLPVQRLGRMALIANDDLQSWEPMKERRPRKYQQQSALRESGSLLFDHAAIGESGLTQRFADICEAIHGDAARLNTVGFLESFGDRFGQTFGFDRVAIWSFDERGGTATRMSRSAAIANPLPTTLRTADFALFTSVQSATGARLVFDLEAEDPKMSAYISPASRAGTLLLVPLRLKERVVGVVMAGRSTVKFDLSEDELSLVQRVANQAAIGWYTARAREAAESRSLLLESMIDELPIGVSVLDTHGASVVRNRAYQEMLQSISPAIPMQSLLDETNMQEAAVGSSLNAALAGDNVSYRELPLEGSEGVIHWLDITARTLRHGDDVAGAVVFAHDVTNMRQDLELRNGQVSALENAARRSEAIAALATEISACQTVQGVVDVTIASLVDELRGASGVFKLRDPDGRFRIRAGYRLELPPAFTLKFDPISYPNTVLAFAQRSPVYITEEEAATFEREAMESMSWHGMLIVPLQIGEEQIGFVFVGYTEATHVEGIDMAFAAMLASQCANALERIRVIGEQEAAHRRLMTVIDQVPQAVVIVRQADGIVTVANMAAEELWGWLPDERPLRAVAFPVLDAEGRMIDQDLHPLLRCVRTGRSYLGEPLTVRRTDGTTVEVLSNHAPVFAADGSITGSVSILQDRVHFKPLDRVKDEFLSVVAHELRNPLTSLRGNVQMLERRIRREGSLSAEDGLRRVETVLNQVDFVAELVSRLLDISRADLGRLDVTPTATDATALVQKVADEASGLAPTREIRLTSPAEMPVVWDQVRIEQILINLIVNAVRYADGAIEISIQAQIDDTIEISVRDHGAGIPPGIRPRLFKQYYRFDDGSHDVEQAHVRRHGLGIGLYLSGRLAEAHGGHLAVGDAEGGGAVFTLVVPRVAQTSRA